MAKKKFSTLPQDNKLVDVLTTIGEVILLNILCIICCMPVVTFTSAFTSFYYGMIKSIRRGIGNPITEFFASMKRTLVKGVIISLIIIIWCLLLWHSVTTLRSNLDTINTPLVIAYVLIALTAMILIYVFAVFSRFDVSIGKVFKLSFLMSIRYIYFTVLLIALAALMIWLQFYILPIVCVCFIPAVYVYISTFMVEKALQKFTPPPEDGQERWYDIKSSKREGVQSDCESKD